MNGWTTTDGWPELLMTKLDEHRSRVPDATDRGSTFHSEETLALVHAVTLAPGAWSRIITNDRCEVQPSSTYHTIYKPRSYSDVVRRESNQSSMASEENVRRSMASEENIRWHQTTTRERSVLMRLYFK